MREARYDDDVTSLYVYPQDFHPISTCLQKFVSALILPRLFSNQLLTEYGLSLAVAKK